MEYFCQNCTPDRCCLCRVFYELKYSRLCSPVKEKFYKSPLSWQWQCHAPPKFSHCMGMTNCHAWITLKHGLHSREYFDTPVSLLLFCQLPNCTETFLACPGLYFLPGISCYSPLDWPNRRKRVGLHNREYFGLHNRE